MKATLRVPGLAEVLDVWRRDGLKKGTLWDYQEWINRFFRYCADRSLAPLSELSSDGADRFVKTYVRSRHIELKACRHGARKALHAFSITLAALGVTVRPWRDSGHPPLLPLFQNYFAFRKAHSNAQDQSILMEITAIAGWLKFLNARRRQLRAIGLRDVDDYLVDIRKRFAASTTARVMSSLRIFLRYFHAIGRLRHDLASSVQGPPRRRIQPPRVLPWADVQRILRAIDRSTRTGARDYAMLLLMSVYGFGAAEIINLSLEDIDWRRKTLTARRSKTGVIIRLPLLPAAAHALAGHLRYKRPTDASRAIFLRRPTPHVAVSRGAVGFAVRRYAHTAGVHTKPLGAHAFRRSYATRQVDQQVPAQILSSILGHSDPKSVSYYTRVAVERLRRIALPVPQ